VRSAADRSVVRHAVGTLSGVVLVENDITIDDRSRNPICAGAGARTVSG
jgi:hypothetical protein